MGAMFFSLIYMLVRTEGLLVLVLFARILVGSGLPGLLLLLATHGGLHLLELSVTDISTPTSAGRSAALWRCTC